MFPSHDRFCDFCFPISYANLIQKGDNFNQRLGDHVDIRMIRLRGHLACLRCRFGETSNNTLASDLEGSLASALPRDSTVIIMLVECDGDEYEADTEQKHHYAATNWPTLTQGGLQKPLRVVGAPRLNEILALEQNSDRLDVRNNQFVPINAPYRSSGDDSEWSDPTKARNVQFTVLADKTFTMKPGSVVPIDWAIHKGVKRLNYPSHLSLDESSVRDEFKSQGTLGNPDPFNPGYAEAAPQVGHPYPDAPDETINTTTVTVKNFLIRRLR